MSVTQAEFDLRGFPQTFVNKFTVNNSFNFLTKLCGENIKLKENTLLLFYSTCILIIRSMNLKNERCKTF